MNLRKIQRALKSCTFATFWPWEFGVASYLRADCAPFVAVIVAVVVVVAIVVVVVVVAVIVVYERNCFALLFLAALLVVQQFCPCKKFPFPARARTRENSRAISRLSQVEASCSPRFRRE